MNSKNDHKKIVIKSINQALTKRILPFLFAVSLFADFSLFANNRSLDRPLLLGPQYPIMYLSTTFLPDSAFVLPQGDFLFQITYLETNSYGFSGNSQKRYSEDAEPDQFKTEGYEGYSVYIDGESHRRVARLHLGLLEDLEVQLIYRDIVFNGGHLDSMTENFHFSFDLGNQNRDRTSRNKLAFYVIDNETGELVFKLTETSHRYRKESVTLGLKFGLSQGDYSALSLSFLSNFGDYYIEKEINEANDDPDEDHKYFNDGVASLNFSTRFASWSLHTAIAVAEVKKSLFENSPDYISYLFAGINWDAGNSWDVLTQLMRYTSPYPKDSPSSLGNEIMEIGLGMRWLFSSNACLEFGFVENQTQGPQNMDITFFGAIAIEL